MIQVLSPLISLCLRPGRGPHNSLKARMHFWSPVMAPTALGTNPVNLFWSRARNHSEAMLATASGMGPARAFTRAWKSSREARAANEAGSCPDLSAPNCAFASCCFKSIALPPLQILVMKTYLKSRLKLCLKLRVQIVKKFR